MKAITWAISLLAGLIIGSVTGCPTCVGRMRISDEPFFSDTFYNKITTPHTRSQQQQLLDEDIEDSKDVDDNGDDEDDIGVSS